MHTNEKNETLSLMMDTSLVSVISINMLQKVPPEQMCRMKADTTELKTDQVLILFLLTFFSPNIKFSQYTQINRTLKTIEVM